VRSTYVAAAMYLDAVLRCIRVLAASLTTESTHYVPYCLARAAMEAGSQAFWLLEPGIGARRRVARFMLLRASEARHQAEQVSITDPGAGSLYGETPMQATDLAVSLGLPCEFRPYKRRYGGQWWCEGEKLPGYTERNKALEAAMFTAGAYSIYSAALHAEWPAVTGNWEELILACPCGRRARSVAKVASDCWAQASWWLHGPAGGQRRAGMSRGHCVTVPEVIALAPVISVAGCERARRHVTPGGAGRRPRHACWCLP
jgi:hypothetical protein